MGPARGSTDSVGDDPNDCQIHGEADQGETQRDH